MPATLSSSYHPIPGGGGWRNANDTTFKIRPYLEKKGIEFIVGEATEIDPAQNEERDLGTHL